MAEQTEAIIATPVELDPYTVELSRGMKGTYGWTIKVRGKDKNDVLHDIDTINGVLRIAYGLESSL